MRKFRFRKVKWLAHCHTVVGGAVQIWARCRLSNRHPLSIKAKRPAFKALEKASAFLQLGKPQACASCPYTRGSLTWSLNPWCKHTWQFTNMQTGLRHALFKRTLSSFTSSLSLPLLHQLLHTLSIHHCWQEGISFEVTSSSKIWDFLGSQEAEDIPNVFRPLSYSIWPELGPSWG